MFMSKILSDITHLSCKTHTLFPKSKKELESIIKNEISSQGICADLNHIDVSGIKDFSGLFEKTSFNGDISEWDVSNAKNMAGMFMRSSFDGDISDWDVSAVTNMQEMFMESEFNQDISGWDVSNVAYMRDTFFDCPCPEEYTPRFK